MALRTPAELYSLDPSSRVNVALAVNDSSEGHAKQVFEALRNDIFLIRMKQIALERYKSEKNINHKTSRDNVKQILDDTGLKEVIVNTIVRLYERNCSLNMVHNPIEKRLVTSRRSLDEAYDCIRKARVAWEVGINEELLTIAEEMKRPLRLIRPVGAANPLLEEGVTSNASMESVRFLFDSEDLFETGIAIRDPKMKQSYLDRSLGLVKLDLIPPGLSELCKKFSELSPQLTQLGLDEMSPHWGSKLSISRHEEGEAIAAFGNALHARKFMRRGVPPSLRMKLWRVAFGLPEEVSTIEEQTFEQLRKECDRTDLITDELFIHDVQNISDDPRFFVFQEELKEIALCFSRDEWVRFNSDYEIHNPLLDSNEDNAGEHKISTPPCAVQPFLGLGAYFAPLFYVFKDQASLYSVTRLSFARLWCRMNVLTSDPGTLLHICKTFEALLISVHPKLFLHLVNIGLQPLQVALPWLQFGFVTLLGMDQILHLWDRVIGYMDTTILAVLATAIFLSRAEPLLTCYTAADAGAMLVEGSRLRVVPLLQMLLFSDTTKD